MKVVLEDCAVRSGSSLQVDWTVIHSDWDKIAGRDCCAVIAAIGPGRRKSKEAIKCQPRASCASLHVRDFGSSRQPIYTVEKKKKTITSLHHTYTHTHLDFKISQNNTYL